MTRVGVTGHQHIPPHALEPIADGIRSLLVQLDQPVEGYSSLAEGADQLFARIVLEHGGTVHAIIPAENYDTAFDEPGRAVYVSLLDAATSIERLPFKEPGEAAYDAAGHRVVDHSDVLVAVWDGEPARGRGGTADAVRFARERGVPVHIVWPDGVTR